MPNEGFIVFDDYYAKHWSGAAKVVDEFFLDNPEAMKFKDERHYPAWYIIKV